jgi:hypothetical protein
VRFWAAWEERYALSARLDRIERFFDEKRRANEARRRTDRLPSTSVDSSRSIDRAPST